MAQILGVFFDWSEISFGIINGIYSVVIRIYNIMLGLINDEGMDMSQFENIATTMYILAGVFILFKVVIAMVQMILNPDLVTDKQAGAGKLIIRIVTCLLMLIAFTPNGFLFGYEGLFSRIERAIIADDGLINNIINNDLSTADSKEKESSGQHHSDSAIDKIFIDNVYAANATTCYYYRIDEAKPNAVPGNTRYDFTIKEIYKIYFYYNPKNTSGLTQAQGDGKVYYKFSEARIGGENGPKYENGKSVYYNKLGYDIKVDSGSSKAIKKGNCPKKMTWGDNVWKASKGDWNAVELGLHGGTKTLNELKKAISNLEKTKGNHVGGGNPFVQSATITDDTMGDNPDAISDATNRQYLSGVEPAAITFGQAVASSVQECATGKEADCIEAQQGMFATKEGNDKIIKLAGDKDLDIGFIISTVAGIGLIIYLLFLCVEVLIRRFKLFFLEVLAPIPAISYVDPKDKTFNNWFKMYISTYLDLFIKLIAISIALALVESVATGFWTAGNETTGIIGGALTKFFYIVAILAFAKILPTMVSKIFNLDSMGGSFKDIMGMAKGAAGFGAGAAIGGAVGLATGGVGGLVRGSLRGAGAGVKGDFTGGAGKTAAYNRNLRNARAAGSTATGRFLAGLGINDYEDKKREIDNEKAKLAEEKANAMEKIQRQKTKNSNTLSNIEGFEKRVEKNFDKNKYDDIKMNDQWSTVQVGSANNAMAKVKAYREASANLKAAESSGDAERIRLAEAEVSATKGAALDAVKNFEAICKVDGEAKAYLENIGSSIVANGFSGDGGIDAQKKSLTASNIALNSQISNLDVKYTEKQQKIEASERALENSKSKANYDAVNKLK